MFGRHPRLAINAFLGLSTNALTATKQTEYVRKLRELFQYAYNKAKEATMRSAAEHKVHYDLKIHKSVLHPGDRVFVHKVGLRGKQKLADRWEHQPYIVRCQPILTYPSTMSSLGNSRSRKTRTLHRNHLLPFMFIPPMKQRQLGTESDNAVEPLEDERIQIDVDGSESAGADVSESDGEIKIKNEFL